MEYAPFWVGYATLHQNSTSPKARLTKALDYQGGYLKIINSLIELALKLIELLRPKFYNRLVWVIVTAGLAMMVSPLLGIIISAILKQSFNLEITNGSDSGWGFSLVVTGLTYHLIVTVLYELIDTNRNKEINARKVAHDIEIFKAADKQLDGDSLADIIDYLTRDHCYRLDNSGKLKAFHNHLVKPENQFLVEGLTNYVQEFLTTSDSLLDFMGSWFHVFPRAQEYGNPRLCLQPNLNIDREGSGTLEEIARYDELSNQLQLLTNNYCEKYELLRAEVKKKLII